MAYVGQQPRQVRNIGCDIGGWKVDWGNRSEGEDAENDDTSMIDPKYVCSICMTILRDPVQTTCGHRFCCVCLNRWLSQPRNKVDSSVCPTCKRTLDDGDFFADKCAQREILEQRSLNRKPKCSASPKSNRSTVLKSENKPTTGHCSFYEFGCFELLTKEEEGLHNEKNVANHLQLLAKFASQFDKFKCELGDKESSLKCTSRSGGQESHSKQNQKHPQETANSKLAIRNSRLGEDLPSQPDKDAMKRFTELMLSGYRILEKKVDEQAINITRMERQFNDIERRLSLLETRHTNGVFVWKIDDFNRKRKDVIYSPGFFSSIYGYKVCLRVHLNGTDQAAGQFFSIFLHFMSGEYDDILDWPFQGRISIAIVGLQADGTKYRAPDIVETVEASNYVGLEAFERPRQLRNPKGFGYHQFAPVSSFNTDYINNDCMFIRATIDSSEQD